MRLVAGVGKAITAQGHPGHQVAVVLDLLKLVVLEYLGKAILAVTV